MICMHVALSVVYVQSIVVFCSIITLRFPFDFYSRLSVTSYTPLSLFNAVENLQMVLVPWRVLYQSLWFLASPAGLSWKLYIWGWHGGSTPGCADGFSGDWYIGVSTLRGLSVGAWQCRDSRFFISTLPSFILTWYLQCRSTEITTAWLSPSLNVRQPVSPAGYVGGDVLFGYSTSSHFAVWLLSSAFHLFCTLMPLWCNGSGVIWNCILYGMLKEFLSWWQSIFSRRRILILQQCLTQPFIFHSMQQEWSSSLTL